MENLLAYLLQKNQPPQSNRQGQIMSGKPLKYPVSALVVLHDKDGNILLIERTRRKVFGSRLPAVWKRVSASKKPHGAKYWKKPVSALQTDSWKTGTTAPFMKSIITGAIAIPKACLKTANTSSPPKFRAICPLSCNRMNTLPTVGLVRKKRRKKCFPLPINAQF